MIVPMPHTCWNCIKKLFSIHFRVYIGQFLQCGGCHELLQAASLEAGRKWDQCWRHALWSCPVPSSGYWYCRVITVTNQQGARLFPPTLLYQNGIDFKVGKFIVPWDFIWEESNFLWTLERSTNTEMGEKEIEGFR